ALVAAANAVTNGPPVIYIPRAANYYKLNASTLGSAGLTLTNPGTLVVGASGRPDNGDDAVLGGLVVSGGSWGGQSTPLLTLGADKIAVRGLSIDGNDVYRSVVESTAVGCNLFDCTVMHGWQHTWRANPGGSIGDNWAVFSSFYQRKPSNG